ncbi:hypothetical protein N8Z79_06525 [Crocinitomicaceae bacterium]|nr:hypothetical protein [Crocinitomicaceae bacterium]
MRRFIAISICILLIIIIVQCMPGPPVTARNSKVLSRKVIRQERKVKRDKKKYLEKKFKRHRKFQTTENKRLMRKSSRKMKKERRKNYRASDMRKDEPFVLEE